jgi:3-isopropylmalate dehydratase small subunit
VEVAQQGEAVAIETPSFVLNRPEYRDGASPILVAGDNFGCGSSREHAPWSLAGLGIRCIISTSFADIFYNNCFKNGMLPLTLPREQVLELLDDGAQLRDVEVDLESQSVIRSNGESFAFDVDPFRKHCLLNGLDDIGLTMEKMEQIRAFESVRSERFPWLDGATTRVPQVSVLLCTVTFHTNLAHNLTRSP